MVRWGSFGCPAKLAKAGNGVFQKASFLIYLLAVSVVFIYMLRVFLMPIFMASVFTGLTYPIYFWLLMKTNNRMDDVTWDQLMRCNPARLLGLQ